MHFQDAAGVGLRDGDDVVVDARLLALFRQVADDEVSDAAADVALGGAFEFKRNQRCSKTTPPRGVVRYVATDAVVDVESVDEGFSLSPVRGFLLAHGSKTVRDAERRVGPHTI